MRRRVALGALGALCALAAAGARGNDRGGVQGGDRGPARGVEPFTAATWAALKSGVSAPTVVVFTSTDCAHCPAVLERLAAERRGHRAPAGARPQLVAVVMDVAPGVADAELLARPYLRACDRLLAFDGPATALRFAVNPAWRGVTPYLAVLRPGLPPRWVTGPPSPADLEAWTAAR